MNEDLDSCFCGEIVNYEDGETKCAECKSSCCE